MSKKYEQTSAEVDKSLRIGGIIKSVCQHEWKIISYSLPSCSWTCKKCGKTVL